MKRSLAIVLALVLAVSLFSVVAGAADDAPAAEPTYVWNLGCIANDPASVPDYNANGNAIQVFADKVFEYSNGQAVVNVHWASVLGSNVTMFEEIMNGTLDFHAGQPMSSADKRFGCWNIPFVYSNYDEVLAATNRADGPVFALSSQWMEDDGVKLLAMGVGSLRGFVSNVEVHTPADCSKLKIRTYEDALVNNYWGSIGTASIIPGSEIYSALQTKTVDAMEFHPTGVYAYRLNEVAGYYAPVNWQDTMGTVLSMPLDLWNSLPEDIQEAIQLAADDYETAQYERMTADTETVLDTLAELGMQITELSEEDMQAWHDSADALEDFFKEFVGEDIYAAYMEALGK